MLKIAIFGLVVALFTLLLRGMDNNFNRPSQPGYLSPTNQPTQPKKFSAPAQPLRTVSATSVHNFSVLQDHATGPL